MHELPRVASVIEALHSPAQSPEQHRTMLSDTLTSLSLSLSDTKLPWLALESAPTTTPPSKHAPMIVVAAAEPMRSNNHAARIRWTEFEADRPSPCGFEGVGSADDVE